MELDFPHVGTFHHIALAAKFCQQHCANMDNVQWGCCCAASAA